MKRVRLIADGPSLEAHLLRAIPRVVSKRIGRTIAGRLGKRTTRLMDQHYKNVALEVRTRLTGTSPSLGVYQGTKRITYSDLDGKVRAISVNWPKLSKRYLLRKPKSYAFWHKTGKLGKEYAAATAWARSNALSVRATGTRVNVAPSGRLPKLELRWTLQFTPMPGVLRSLVSQTFVTARGSKPVGVTVGTDPLDRILYPETGTKRAPPRPFLRAISARLGARAHLAVRHDVDRWRALLQS